MDKIPVTVFTGYLGSGKTTIILNLLKQLPKDYKLVMLKNEFGDTAVDSQLAKESNLGVKEYLNGCLCCVLIGKLSAALNELLDTYHPDRIIIETSGSAYPGPIAWEIRKSNRVYLDGLVTVIDAINFEGYQDKSYTAKLQTKDTDLILINKHEGIKERDLDEVLDDVYELNPDTPKVKTDKGTVDPDLIFGLDSQLYSALKDVEFEEKHKDAHHHEHEVDTISLESDKTYSQEEFEKKLSSLPSSDFYRIKGMVKFDSEFYIVNYVFGKFNFKKLSAYKGKTKIVFMGPYMKQYKEKLEKMFDAVSV